MAENQQNHYNSILERNLNDSSPAQDHMRPCNRHDRDRGRDHDRDNHGHEHHGGSGGRYQPQ